MKPSRNLRLSKARLKRSAIVLAVLLAVGLLVYAEIIRPNQHAKAYETRLGTAAEELHGCFVQLADTEDLRIFYAPDIPLTQKQSNVTTIKRTVGRCSGELQRFYYDAQNLQPMFLSGYTDGYRQANAAKAHALNIAGQSNDVLKQYGRMTDFLGRYYESLGEFLAYTDALNRVTDLESLRDKQTQLREQGSELRSQAAAIQALEPAPGFEPVIEPTAAMVDQAANGFELLADGYGRQDDATITAGFSDIEAAVADYNASVQQLPFDLLLNAYATKQVAALPDKIASVRRAAVE